MFYNEEYRMVEGVEDWTPMIKMYQDYQEWCYLVNKKPLARPNFIKDLKANVEGFDYKVKSSDNKVQRSVNMKPRSDKVDEFGDIKGAKEIDVAQLKFKDD